MNKTPISWAGIARLGLVQTSLGAIVVMTTSTLNRIMVVELALPAMLPGFLVAIHYYIQILRPRFGHGSDTGQARTPWIIGGMAVLAFGGVLASAATALMQTSTLGGVLLATVAFILIGAGVGASGTCLLVLLAATVDDRRRAAAASITWIMMIAGFAVTAGVIGAFLDPFSFQRLLVISAVVSTIAFTTTVLALGRIERRHSGFSTHAEPRVAAHDFKSAIRDVMSEPHTRRFAAFVFISMLAYSAQDLVLEPFAGAVFGLSPGESTQLGGTQHGGVLLGMLLVAFIGYRLGDGRHSVLRRCMISGCLASSALLLVLAGSGYVGSGWPLHANVALLGVANGVFAVAAIGSMMGLVSRGHRQRDGVRMGVWGAAQAIAFGLGGMVGTAAVDIVRWLSGSALHAYSLVFLAQAALFACAAFLAAELSRGHALTSNDAIGVKA